MSNHSVLTFLPCFRKKIFNPVKWFWLSFSESLLCKINREFWSLKLMLPWLPISFFVWQGKIEIKIWLINVEWTYLKTKDWQISDNKLYRYWLLGKMVHAYLNGWRNTIFHVSMSFFFVLISRYRYSSFTYWNWTKELVISPT